MVVAVALVPSAPPLSEILPQRRKRKIVEFKGLFFRNLFNVLRGKQIWSRKVHIHRYRWWRPVRQWEEWRRWGGGNWLRSHSQFFCVIQKVVDSWCQEENSYSTLWCVAWADKQNIWCEEVVSGDCEGSVGIQSEGDLLYQGWLVSGKLDWASFYVPEIFFTPLNGYLWSHSRMNAIDRHVRRSLSRHVRRKTIAYGVKLS